VLSLESPGTTSEGESFQIHDQDREQVGRGYWPSLAEKADGKRLKGIVVRKAFAYDCKRVGRHGVTQDSLLCSAAIPISSVLTIE